jgi:uncharacterized protein YceK
MKKILSILVLSSIVTGCASIFKGTDQTVTFTSEPSNASVIIDGQNRGKTPLTIKLKKNAYSTIRIQKKGYRAASRPLEKKYDGIAILNIFWDSSTTDFITGAAYEYEPNSYHFELEKKTKEDE